MGSTTTHAKHWQNPGTETLQNNAGGNPGQKLTRMSLEISQMISYLQIEAASFHLL